MPLSHSVSRLLLYALANNTANVTLCYAVEGEIKKELPLYIKSVLRFYARHIRNFRINDYYHWVI